MRLAILKSFAREPDHKLQGPTKERGGPAGLIVKEGYIIAQWGDIERVDMTFRSQKVTSQPLQVLLLMTG